MNYIGGFKKIGRNVKLFLLSNILTSVGLGAFFVIFNIYLKEIGLRGPAIGKINGAIFLLVLSGTIPVFMIKEKYAVRSEIPISKFQCAFFTDCEAFFREDQRVFSNTIFIASVCPFACVYKEIMVCHRFLSSMCNAYEFSRPDRNPTPYGIGPGGITRFNVVFYANCMEHFPGHCGTRCRCYNAEKGFTALFLMMFCFYVAGISVLYFALRGRINE